MLGHQCPKKKRNNTNIGDPSLVGFSYSERQTLRIHDSCFDVLVVFWYWYFLVFLGLVAVLLELISLRTRNPEIRQLEPEICVVLQKLVLKTICESSATRAFQR